jgi:uncharacterized protein (TIGR02270 family)
MQAEIDFLNELFLQHLEEASFLYEQRLGLLDDPELSWKEMEDFENRFEPHIDSLMVGQEAALAICRKQVEEGDFGELHAAVRVFCRQNRSDIVLGILQSLVAEDHERLQAVADALNHDFPASWQDEFLELLAKGRAPLQSIIIRVIGYRRLPAGDALIRLVQKNQLDNDLPTAWTLGRLRDRDARSFLLDRCLRHDREDVRQEAAIALLRMGESETLRVCLERASEELWAVLPLALAGGFRAASVLMPVAAPDDSAPECLLALGLLGDVSAVNILLEKLGRADSAEAASLALYLITGADLMEEEFIPEKIDKDELFDEELEKLERGESLYPDGEPPPGLTIKRISQNGAEWRKWWKENAGGFASRSCYRNGKPYDPKCLIDNMESEILPRRLRQTAYEELVIRYGIDYPFETDMTVARQRRAISRYQAWYESEGKRFGPGKWYFAGRIIA